MLKQYPIGEARDQFTALVRALEQETAIELTRRGKPVAVLLSFQEYKRMSSQKTNFWEAYQTFRQKVDLENLDIEPETFTGLRDKSPGREVSW